MSEAATGRRMLGEIEETSLDEVRTILSVFPIRVVKAVCFAIELDIVSGLQTLIGDKRTAPPSPLQTPPSYPQPRTEDTQPMSPSLAPVLALPWHMTWHGL